jgi:hypothetical protein
MIVAFARARHGIDRENKTTEAHGRHQQAIARFAKKFARHDVYSLGVRWSRSTKARRVRGGKESRGRIGGTLLKPAPAALSSEADVHRQESNQQWHAFNR